MTRKISVNVWYRQLLKKYVLTHSRLNLQTQNPNIWKRWLFLHATTKINFAMQVLCVLCHFGYGRQKPTSTALRVRTEMGLLKENPSDRLYWARYYAHFSAPCWIQKASPLTNHRSNAFPALSFRATIKIGNQHLLSARKRHFYRKRVIKPTGDFLISFINGVVEARALVQRSQRSWHSRTGGKPHF